MRCSQTLEVGVYVLGALAPAERDAFERHLSDCATCRDEVADLAVLPGLLGRLDLATAESIAREGEGASAIRDGRAAVQTEEPDRWVGPTLRSVPDIIPEVPADIADPAPDPQRWAGPPVVTLLEGARHRRTAEKRRRRIYTFAAGLVAACLALVVGLSVPVFLRDNGPNMTAMAAAAGVTSPIKAEVGFRPIVGGTKVIMHCTYSDAGTHERWQFKLVAVAKSGAEEQLNIWSAGNGDDLVVSATTTLKPDEIDYVEVRRMDGTVLLRLDR